MQKTYAVISIILIVIITRHDITTVIVEIIRVLDARTPNGDKRNNPQRYTCAASCGLVHIIANVHTENLSGGVIMSCFSGVDIHIFVHLLSMKNYQLSQKRLDKNANDICSFARLTCAFWRAVQTRETPPL